MLVLTIGSYSAVIREFLDTAYPRLAAEFSQPKVDYSPFGSAALYAPPCPTKHLWTVNAVASPGLTRALKAVAAEFEFRQKPQNGYISVDILVDDYTDTILERTPRTRAIASGSAVIPVGADQIEYHARFKAAFIALPKLTRMGGLDGIAFTLTETTITTP